MNTHQTTYGYFHISIKAPGGARLLHTNDERAFIIAQLQDLLSARLILGDVPAHKQLASCIDLLAFSITGDAITLLAFSVDTSINVYFANCIVSRFEQYVSELSPGRSAKRYYQTPVVTMKRLSGEHEALRHSIALHFLHKDWEFDRYSSIGFYLHDRRGDWMRIWRLAKIYENNPHHYRELMITYRHMGAAMQYEETGSPTKRRLYA